MAGYRPGMAQFRPDQFTNKSDAEIYHNFVNVCRCNLTFLGTWDPFYFAGTWGTCDTFLGTWDPFLFFGDPRYFFWGPEILFRVQTICILMFSQKYLCWQLYFCDGTLCPVLCLCCYFNHWKVVVVFIHSQIHFDRHTILANMTGNY